MPTFTSKRHVRHSASDMFDLVADMERYPEFLPFCSAMKLRIREKNSEGNDVIVADMTVAYKLIRETFRSKVTLHRAKHKISVEYLDGPFSQMQNRWSFRPTDESTCEVQFYIDYEFKSRVLGLLMGAMFDTIFRRFTIAFERRADEIYTRKIA